MKVQIELTPEMRRELDRTMEHARAMCEEVARWAKSAEAVAEAADRYDQAQPGTPEEAEAGRALKAALKAWRSLLKESQRAADDQVDACAPGLERLEASVPPARRWAPFTHYGEGHTVQIDGPVQLSVSSPEDLIEAMSKRTGERGFNRAGTQGSNRSTEAPGPTRVKLGRFRVGNHLPGPHEGSTTVVLHGTADLFSPSWRWTVEAASPPSPIVQELPARRASLEVRVGVGDELLRRLFLQRGDELELEVEGERVVLSRGGAG